MKFNQSLKFNIVPEWSEAYISYDNLKKIIYNLQKKQIELGQFNSNDTTVSEFLDQINNDLSKSSSRSSNSTETKTETNEIHHDSDNDKKNLDEISMEKGLIVEAEKTFDISEIISKLDGKKKKKTLNPLLEFTKQLLFELEKIDNFYQKKYIEINKEFEDLIKDLISLNEPNIFNFLNLDENDDEKISKITTHYTINDELEEVDSSDDEENYQTSALVHPKNFNLKNQKLITLKQMNKSIFIKLNELKSFIELNKIGFSKISKKFDKNLNYNIKEDLVNNFLPNNSVVFNESTIIKVDKKIETLTNSFTYLSYHLDDTKTMESIKFELNSYLRDHIIWERNTVWKDLLSLQSKRQDFSVNSNNLLHLNFETYNVFGRSILLPSFLISWQTLKVLITIIVFFILVDIKTMNDPVEGKCLAVLVAAAILWATEALPLYATAMLIPLLIVTCGVLRNDDGSVMETVDASKTILSTMWSSVIMVLIGGFTLAAALSKYNIARIISSWILSWVGTKPRNILLTIMMVSLFLSMWISNVATPILCYSLIQPILKTIPSQSPFAQALILGIALACNVAGMSSPISSPQNVVAIESMDPNPGWGNWFAVALPVSIISCVGIWLELIFTFKINTVTVKPYKPIKDRLTVKQIFVLMVTLVTVLLWCVLTRIETTFGEAGIISIIPVVLFFGTGLLKTDDLNNFPWAIVLLAMGGLALGKGVSSSGLLSTVALSLQARIMDYNAWVVMIIFGILVLVFATFVSHTVAALIIVPLVKEVGENLPQNHANLLVMGTALLASAAMGLPTSGFPNVTAISMTDELGNRYLTVNTFINRGVPASFIAFAVTITVGYGIMSSLGF